MHSNLEDICISFYDEVYYYVLSLARDKELAKDITQEAFLKALKSLHTLKDDSKVKSWLFSIARNGYFTEMKKRNKLSFDELLEDLVDVQGLTPEQIYLLREQEEWWDRILKTLNEEEQRICQLRVHEKYSYDEIAQVLAIKSGVVRVKFHRLRIKLINLLEKRVKDNEGL